MANLYQDDRTIIAKNPLDNSLYYLRDSLRKAGQCYAPGPIPYTGAVDDSDQTPQEAISKLLGSLGFSDAALFWHSTMEVETAKTLHRSLHNSSLYRALSRLVIKKASKFDIWKAV